MPEKRQNISFVNYRSYVKIAISSDGLQNLDYKTVERYWTLLLVDDLFDGRAVLVSFDV